MSFKNTSKAFQSILTSAWRGIKAVRHSWTEMRNSAMKELYQLPSLNVGYRFALHNRRFCSTFNQKQEQGLIPIDIRGLLCPPFVELNYIFQNSK